MNDGRSREKCNKNIKKWRKINEEDADADAADEAGREKNYVRWRMAEEEENSIKI